MKKMAFSDKFCQTKAVLEGRQTQKRMIITPKEMERINQYQQEYYDASLDWLDGKELIASYFFVNHKKRLPYKVGDVVAIAQNYKDTWLIKPNTYKSPYFLKGHKGWNNKMFARADLMPHHIRITSVKIERLQDISDVDCMKEGVETMESYAIRADGTKKTLNYYRLAYRCKSGRVLTLLGDTAREVYAALIDRISGKGTWSKNPFVFVYEFELVD